MTTNRLLTLATLVAVCGSSALAQQTAPAPVPVTPPSTATQKFVHGNMQYRGPIGPGEAGVRHDFRIAPPGMWWKNPDLVQKLSLTADQQKRMDDIFQQSRLQLIDLKANVEKQEVLLEPMLSANPPDTNKVLAQIDHVASARAELEKANARMLLGIRGVLSADQWTKLQAERAQRRMQIFRGPGGPGGQGFFFKGPDGFKGPGGPGPESLKGPNFLFKGSESFGGPEALDSFSEQGFSVALEGPLNTLTLPQLPTFDMEIDIAPEEDLNL